MSRARDMANLGAQAGSGLDASDITTGTFSTSVIPNLAGDKITSGTLSNTVQDNITRLGTVTTGTMNNTIGSNATFPTGKLINSKFFRVNTGSDHSTTSATDQAALNYVTFNCTSGNTIYFGYNFYAVVSHNSGTLLERYARFKLYQRASTGPTDTRPAEGDTTNLGTYLWNSVFGRTMNYNGSSIARTSYAPYMASASFLATANTHYLGLVFNNEVSGLLNILARSASNPVTFFAMEFEGDVATEGAIP